MVHLPVSYRWLSAVGAAFTTAVLAPSVAQAHIKLTEPAGRYDADLKGCPCGKATGGGGSNGTCNVEMDGSDPNRNESRVFTAVAGSTLVIKFQETIGHTGLYRVAFDDDGADFADFNQNVLAEADDPNDGNGAREITVTVPNTPCTNCTLQLIQVMDARLLGGTVDGEELAQLSTYYACADLVITGDGASTGGETSGETSGGASTFDMVSAGSSEAPSSAEASLSSSAVPGASSGETLTSSPTPPPAITAAPPTPPPAVNPVPPPPVTPAQPSVTQAPPTTTTPPAATTAAPTETAVASKTEGGCSVGPASRSGFGELLVGIGLASVFFGRRRRSSRVS